jgi:ketohexokinase
MARILCTGVAVLDIINYVDHFPRENEELRATHQELRLGGNSANTAKVLTQYGHDLELLACFSNDSAGDWLTKQLTLNGIGSQHSPRLDGQTPTSYITLNSENGSRTILHHRKLPELDFQHFSSIQLQDFDWFHFESRNIKQTRFMLDKCPLEHNNKTISLELEKYRHNDDQLIELADLLMFSRSYVEHLGFTNPRSFLATQQAFYPDKKITCTWGRGGSYGIAPCSDIIHVSANIPTDIVDTIGAGDTFNAGLINALINHSDFPAAIAQACHLATTKICQQGFDQLVSRAFP